MRRRLDRQFLLAFEMMEEAALGEARIVADVVNRRRRIALGADDVQRGIEQPGFRFVPGVGGCHGKPYQLLGMAAYQLVGMESSHHGKGPACTRLIVSDG